MIKFLDLQQINARYKNEMMNAFERVADSGWYLMGDENKQFEENLNQYIGTSYTVGVANGLDALRLILRAYRETGFMKDGDEVIVPANTYIATILAITDNNLKPILIEPDIETYNIDITKIEEIPSHGGSLRCYAKHGMNSIIEDEKIEDTGFSDRCKKIKNDWIRKLKYSISSHDRIAAFGAAAKGITFLNYLGLDKDTIDFCVDETPYKQGKFMPGSKIPITTMDELIKQKPSYILILPWNHKEEIINKLQFTKEWGCELLSR